MLLKCTHSKVICLLMERNFHTPNMTNMVIIQYTIFMTLIIEFNLGIKLNTEMVKILNKLSFTGFVFCFFYKKHWSLI